MTDIQFFSIFRLCAVNNIGKGTEFAKLILQTEPTKKKDGHIVKGFYEKKENKVQSFFRGKGFYIVLIVCLFGVGVLGYVTLKGLNSPPNDEYLYNSKASNSSASLDIPVLNNDTGSKAKSQSSASSSSKKTVSGSDEAVDVLANDADKLPLTYKMPVSGNILKPFTTEPVKSVTLGDWRAHYGTDIAAAKNTQVKAAASGTVEDVSYDEMMGWKVVIKHADGIRTVYANLNPSVTVKKGAKVKVGKIIGSVGTTALEEEKDEPHLHLEVIKNGEQIDPLSLIK